MGSKFCSNLSIAVIPVFTSGAGCTVRVPPAGAAAIAPIPKVLVWGPEAAQLVSGTVVETTIPTAPALSVKQSRMPQVGHPCPHRVIHHIDR